MTRSGRSAGGLLFDLGEIGVFEHDDVAGQVGLDGGKLLRSRPVPVARGAQRGRDADFGQQRRQADDQVLLAVDDRPLAEDVLVGVDVGVDQPAALVFVAAPERAGR